MATTIKQAFSEYSSQLNVTDRQESVVSTCRQNVVNKLKNELSLHPNQSSKLIGSYDRKTIIRYLGENDVDVMVVLHYGDNNQWENPAGVQTALQKFKDIISSAYPSTNMRIDRNCVTMELSKFTLDVVPAFYYTDGTYRIPDTYQRVWLTTNPVKFAELITSVNTNMSGTFVPLIKMVKGWNRESGFPLRGFHLECLMYNHYKDYNQSYSYQSTLQVFFSNLPSYLRSNCYDPSTGDCIDGYLDNFATETNREKAIKKALKAAEISGRARQYEENHPATSEYAIKEWKSLLGEFYPNYG